MLYSVLPQAIVAGLVLSSTYILVASGFTLIYSVARFFEFSHAAIFTVGGYVTLTLFTRFGMNLVFIFPLVFLVTAALGTLLEIGIYSPLRRRGAGSLNLMLASLALTIIVQTVISMVYGDNYLGLGLRASLPISIFEVAVISSYQVLMIAVSLCASVLLVLWIRYSRTGLSMRAVAANAEAAKVVGINLSRAICVATFIGSGFAGIGAFLFSIDRLIFTTMGINVVISAIVASILGGVGSIVGAMVGAVIIGVVENLTAITFSAQLQDVFTFLILIFAIVLRPEGLISRKGQQQMRK